MEMMGGTEAGLVVSFGDTQYYVPAQSFKLKKRGVIFEKEKSKEKTDYAFTPATVFHFDDLNDINYRSLDGRVTEYLETDDIFSKLFLKTVFISVRNDSQEISRMEGEFGELLKTWGTSCVTLISTLDYSLPPGPYFILNSCLRQAWRCYPDPFEAFTTGTIPSRTQTDLYEIPPTRYIPVPSRLYFDPPCPSKPLSGLRMAVKDVIDLKGTKTSNCCRAYEQLYGPRQKTAPCIQLLIDLGAVVVGKTKTVQFASGSHPLDWVDTLCSFNCRGDGYQSPSMSSVGSAAAMAAYEWLDFAVGTDTLGSTITPASVCGLFAIRPTLGAVDLTGVIPVSGQLDTVGLFARSINLISSISKLLYTNDARMEQAKLPAELIYPEDLWPSQNEPYQTAIDEFVCSLEKYMRTKALRINLHEAWKESNRAPGVPLSEYLKTSLAHIQLYDCYHNGTQFTDDYKAKFGSQALVDPTISYKWGLGQRLSQDDYDKAVSEKANFSDWMSTGLMSASSRRLLIFPADGDVPTYRDQYFGSAEESGKLVQGFGLKPFCLPALLSMPAFSVPIGQYSYQSKISGKEEFLPICVNLIGPKGSESAVCEFLEAFIDASAGLHANVIVGKETFEREKDISRI